MSTNAFVASQLLAKGFQEIILEATFVSSLWNSSHLHAHVQRALCNVYLHIFLSRTSPLTQSTKNGSNMIATLNRAKIKRESKRKDVDGKWFRCLMKSVSGGRDRLEAASGAGGGEEGLPAQHCHDMR